MKEYKSSDYAINKYSDGIVYRFNNQIVTITMERFLAENPNQTEADFWKLKALSDEIYLEQVKTENAQTKKNIPISPLEDTEVCAVDPIEEYIDRQEEKAFLQDIRLFLNSNRLTETQYRRFCLYFCKGLTVRQIAKQEATHHKSVEESIEAAIKKLKKFLQDTPPKWP